MGHHLNEDIMDFNKKGYHVVNNFIEPEFLKFIQDYFAIRINAGHASLYDIQAPNSYSFYGDPLTETILQNSCEAISNIIQMKLLPTYSYCRLYTTGDELKIHTDRPSCEISATLSLGIPEGEEINPILFSPNSDGSNPSEILLEPGDLCIYKGYDLYHWRPPFKNKWCLQSFFHFVIQDGQYSEFIYDKRPYLGFNK